MEIKWIQSKDAMRFAMQPCAAAIDEWRVIALHQWQFQVLERKFDGFSAAP